MAINSQLTEKDLSSIQSYINANTEDFSQRLLVLSNSQDMRAYNKDEIASVLKSYKISNLFLPGEILGVYNNENDLVVDNHMRSGSDTLAKHLSYFTEVNSVHEFYGSIVWKGFFPYRKIAVTIKNANNADGVLSGELSLKRFYPFLNEYSLRDGQELFMVDERGDVLFHTDAKVVRDKGGS